MKYAFLAALLTGAGRRVKYAFFATLLIGAGILMLVSVGSRGQTQVAPQPGPLHVQYEPHQVGGYVLVNPTAPDSSRFLLLPPGSVLLLPRLVPGEDPETSWRKS